MGCVGTVGTVGMVVLTAAITAAEMLNGPQVYYTDATAHSLRRAWWTSAGWHFETLDGPGSTLSGRTGHQVGAGVAVTDY